MTELTDVRYPIACWNAWCNGDDYALVELVRALSSPSLTVRVLARAILKENSAESQAGIEQLPRTDRRPPSNASFNFLGKLG